jgi:hypothetical protein
MDVTTISLWQRDFDINYNANTLINHEKRINQENLRMGILTKNVDALVGF